VADRIWELTPAGLNSYKGNYSAYKIQKENEDKHTAKEYEKQQLRIKQLNQAIRSRRNGWQTRKRVRTIKMLLKHKPVPSRPKRKNLPAY
jgi:ATPase subunit of ABC transporter with duplicated ATPase domains